MKPEQTVEALEQAASQLGVQVRYETMTGDAAGGGGLCKIRGNWCVIMDRKTPPAERAAMLIDALIGFDTDTVFLPPKIRENLATRRTERQSPPAATQAEAPAATPAEATIADEATVADEAIVADEATVADASPTEPTI